jgi:transposase-like protein
VNPQSAGTVLRPLCHHAQHRRVAEQVKPRFPEAGPPRPEAAPDILAFTAFPVAHWREVWSNNSLERLNKEA